MKINHEVTQNCQIVLIIAYDISTYVIKTELLALVQKLHSREPFIRKLHKRNTIFITGNNHDYNYITRCNLCSDNKNTT